MSVLRWPEAACGYGTGAHNRARPSAAGRASVHSGCSKTSCHEKRSQGKYSCLWSSEHNRTHGLRDAACIGDKACLLEMEKTVLLGVADEVMSLSAIPYAI